MNTAALNGRPTPATLTPNPSYIPSALSAKTAMSMWPRRLACPGNAIIRRMISFGLIVIWVVAGTVRDTVLINVGVAFTFAIPMHRDLRMVTAFHNKTYWIDTLFTTGRNRKLVRILFLYRSLVSVFFKIALRKVFVFASITL